MGKIPESIRASLLRRVDTGLAVLLLASVAVHFGCVGWLHTLDFPRHHIEAEAAPPRPVSYRPPPRKADVPVAEPKVPARRPSPRPVVSRASLAVRMRQLGVLDVLTSRGDKESSLSDVLKHDATPADADQIWRNVGGVTDESSTDLWKPKGVPANDLKRGGKLKLSGPADVPTGNREGEQGPVTPAGRRPEVDQATPVEFGGAFPASPERVWHEVRAHMSAVKACYYEALRITPMVQGKLVVRLDVSALGEVTHVAFPLDTVHDLGMTECIRMRAGHWRLPPSDGPYHFSVPLVFVTR